LSISIYVYEFLKKFNNTSKIIKHCLEYAYSIYKIDSERENKGDCRVITY